MLVIVHGRSNLRRAGARVSTLTQCSTVQRSSREDGRGRSSDRRGGGGRVSAASGLLRAVHPPPRGEEGGEKREMDTPPRLIPLHDSPPVL